MSSSTLTAVCAVGGCGQKLRARGYCAAHLHRLNRYGDPTAGPERAPRLSDFPCIVAECERRQAAKGLCKMHHRRVRKHGSTDPSVRQLRPLADRMAAMTDTDGPVPDHRPDLGPCHVWLGGLAAGYGVVGLGTREEGTAPAHRVAWELENGPIPEGLHLDHLCERTSCVRPSHLEPVTQEENNRRARVSKARRGDLPIGELLTRYDAARPRSRQTTTARRAGKWGVGASDVKSCRAAVGFRERGWGEDPDAELAAPFGPVPLDSENPLPAILGTAIHEAYAKAQRRYTPWRMVEAPVMVPGLDVESHVDSYDPLLERVEDLKSKGEWGWEKLGDVGPPEEDWAQAFMYGLGLVDAGHTVRTVRLTYVRRANGQAESFDRPYNHAAALASVARMHGVLDALDENRPLPRDRSGPNTDGLCRGCPFRTACWGPELVALAVRRTVEGLMLAHDDEGIAKAGLEYVEAREAKADPEKRQKVAAALVRGVPEGRYGDVIIREVGGKKSWEPDVAARVEQLEDKLREIAAGDAEPVDPGALPVPEREKVSTVRIDVTRVRAAQLEQERREREEALQQEAGGA